MCVRACVCVLAVCVYVCVFVPLSHADIVMLVPLAVVSVWLL